MRGSLPLALWGIAAASGSLGARGAEAFTLLEQQRSVRVESTVDSVAYTCLDELLAPGCPVLLDRVTTEEVETAPDATPFEAAVSLPGADAAQQSSLGAPLQLAGTASSLASLAEVCVYGEPGCEGVVQIVEVEETRAESRVELELLLDEPTRLSFLGGLRAIAAPVPASQEARVELALLDAEGAPLWSQTLVEQADDSGLVAVDAEIVRPAGRYGLRVVASSFGRGGQLPIGPITASAASELDLVVALAPAAPVPALPGPWAGALAAVLAALGLRTARATGRASRRP